MFPNNINEDNEDNSQVQNYNVISDSEKIRKTPNFDFVHKSTVIKNGDVNLVDDYQNVRNWIIKFIRTPIDVYQIYEGTGFGTSAYRLRGYKAINGLLYAQIQKEIEEGFKLNPNIVSVEDVQLQKNNKMLEIYVKCKLKDGYILEEKQEVYSLK